VGGVGNVIEIGTAIVSYIEPHPGQARAFNEWYELDHFPAAVLAGPGVFAGARFIATSECKARRVGSLLGDPQRGTFLAVAWVSAGKQAEWDAWVAREMETIAAEGRLFPGREHVHTAVYRFIAAAGERSPVVALAAGSAGVIASSRPLGIDAPVTVTLGLERTVISSVNPPAHELVLAFCDDDPLRVFKAPADCAYASPFVSVVPGTNTHVEETA
jgi:hypothetical protein